MEKLKSESDLELIVFLLQGLQPLDWSRRENGDLVFLNQAGQKFVMTPADIDDFKKRIGKLVPKAKAVLEAELKSRSHHRRVPQERNAEIPEARNPQGSSVEGKKALDSMPEPEEKELTEEQAPYDAEANVP